MFKPSIKPYLHLPRPGEPPKMGDVDYTQSLQEVTPFFLPVSNITSINGRTMWPPCKRKPTRRDDGLRRSTCRKDADQGTWKMCVAGYGEMSPLWRPSEKKTKPMYTDICSVLHPHTKRVTEKLEGFFFSFNLVLEWKTLFSFPKEREKTKLIFLDVGDLPFQIPGNLWTKSGDESERWHKSWLGQECTLVCLFFSETSDCISHNA